ncbi:MAG: DUF503 domain-containing protein [Deltaproteobacteria bacterium]|nr:DUF503 domain-containing protein [Deltaproteobacteria bacterium]
MVVGMLQVSLFLPENASLKGKRKVVKSLLGRLKVRFNLSAAEVADNDLWQRIEIGVSVVGNDRRYINSVLDNVLDYVEQETEAQVLDSRIEIINVFSEAVH